MSVVVDAGPGPVQTRLGSPLLLLVLCAAEFVTILDFSIVTVALADMERELGLSATALPWVLNAYGLGIAALLLLAGRLADLIGRRALFATGMAVFGLSSLLGGFADSAAQLITARAAQGIGAALVTPAALAIITTTYRDPVRRSRALGVWGAVGASGLTAGLVAGAVITSGLGWRWVLWITVPIALVSLLLTPFVVPASTRLRGERLDLPGAGLVVIGLTAVVLGTGELAGRGWLVRAALLATAGLAMALFLRREHHAKSPLVHPVVLGTRAVWSTNLVSVAANAGFAPAIVILSLHGQLELGLNALRAGLLLAPVAAGVTLASAVVTPRLLRLFTARRVVIAGLAVSAVGGVLLYAATVAEAAWWWTLPGSVLAGLGYGLAFPAWTLVGVDRVPEIHQGVAAGLMTTSQEVGAAVGLAAAVAVSVGSSGYGPALLVLAAVTALGAALATLITASTVHH